MFTTITVTAHYTGPSTPKGWVSFTLSAPMADTSGQTIVTPEVFTAKLDNTGAISIPLTANDDPTTAPQGTFYTVVEQINSGPQRTYQVTISHSAPGGTVDLSTLGPPLAGSPFYSYVLQSLLGAPNGVATLGSDGYLASAQRPPTSGGLLAANNLGDVASASTSRENLHVPYDSMPANMVGTGRYNPDKHVYTPVGGQTLVKWPAKLAQARQHVGRAKLACIGPSGTAGYNGTTSLRGIADFPYQINEMVHASGWDCAEPTFTFVDSIGFDNRISITGTWNYSSHPNPEVYLVGSAGATMTLPCSKFTDTVEVAVSGNSGAIVIQVDGVTIQSTWPGLTVANGSYSTQYLVPGGGSYITKVTIPGLPYAAHTVKLTLISAATLFWVDCYYSKGVSVANFGSCGTRTADWNNTSLFYTLLELAIAWGPDAVILDTGMQFNSWQGGEQFSTSLTNFEGIISTLAAAGIEVFLMGMTPGISPTLGTPPTAFWQNLYTLADATGCAMLENFTAWGSSEAVAQANGLVAGVADQVHPSASGYSAISKSIVDTWSLESWKRLLPWKVTDATLVSAPVSPMAKNSLTPVNANAGAFSVVLPTAPDDGTLVGLLHVGTNGNLVTVTPGGSDTVTGSSTLGQGGAQIWVYFAALTTWMTLANSLTLDKVLAPVGPVSLGSQKITSLANGSASTDGVAFGQISQLVNGNVTAWAANTAVGAYTLVQLPTRGLAYSTTARTTRASFDATEKAAWTFIPGGHYEVFIVSGSWVCPTGIVAARLRMVGGGAGGGGGGSAVVTTGATAQVGGGGGGAGQVFSWEEVGLTPGNSYAFTAGAGGAGGGGAAANGAAGSDGTFGSDSTFVGVSNTKTAKGGGQGKGGTANVTVAVSGGLAAFPGGVAVATSTICGGNGGPSGVGCVWMDVVVGGSGGGAASASLGGGAGLAAAGVVGAQIGNPTAGGSGTVNGVNGTTATYPGCGGGGGGGGSRLSPGGTGGTGGSGATGGLEIWY